MNSSSGAISASGMLGIESPAFENRGEIPTKYTCDGDNINPPITIDNLPPETRSVALIVEDPDAPSKTWIHWLLWNIEPTGSIDENSVPGIQGFNDFRKKEYGGPCPPAGTHRYFFKVFALNKKLDLREGSTVRELEKAMKPYIISKGELIGTYQRK